MIDTPLIKRSQVWCPHCKHERMNQGFILRLDKFFQAVGLTGDNITSGWRCKDYYEILYARLRLKYNNPDLKVPATMPHNTGLCVDTQPIKLAVKRADGFYQEAVDLFHEAEKSGLFNKIGVADNFLHIGATPDQAISRWYYDPANGKDATLTDAIRKNLNL